MALTKPKAEQIEFIPSGGLVATNLQAALAELDSDKTTAANLAASSGSSLVGYDGSTVQDVLDAAKPMQSYTALRNYTGRATGVRITTPGIAGFFQRRSTTGLTDNGGTIIIDALGRAWERLFVGPVNIKWFGAKGDWNGTTGSDDTEAIQAAINYVQSYGSNAQIYSNGSNDTLFGGKLFSPGGRYKITAPLVVNPVAKEGATALYAGITWQGESNTATVFDATFMPAGLGSAIKINGSFVEILDFQVLNAPGHGIGFNETDTNAVWNVKARNIYVNKPGGDGMYSGRSFKCAFDGCTVYGAGGYGYSWNSYHTSMNVENNYAIQCVLGGYFSGNRVDIGASLGMVYSQFSANACDGGIDAYTFHGGRGISMTGNGCEIISGKAIYVTGSDANVTIDQFFAVAVSGNGIYAAGNRVKIKVSGFYDLNPINPNTPLFGLYSNGGTVELSSIKNARSVLYDYGAFSTFVYTADNKYIRSVLFSSSSASATIGKIVGDTLNAVNVGGKFLIEAITYTSRDNANARQQATYELLVSISAAGKFVSAQGVGGTGAGAAILPAFTWSIDASNNLVATRTFTGTLDDRTFTFVITSIGNIGMTFS